MKKLVLIVFLTLLAATFALAQEQEEEKVEQKPSWSGFVTNKFWDNWEISVGGGSGTVFTHHAENGAHKDRFGWNADLSVAKWIHPVFGVRIQARYGEYHNFTTDLERVRWGAWYLHGDAMINFSNWVGGYREDRVYYAVPFLSAGYYGKNFRERGAFAFGIGWLSKFRVCPQVDINFELAEYASPTKVAPISFPGHTLFTATASLGVTYRFRERAFKRGVAGYTPAQIEALKAEIAANLALAEAAQTENEKLKASLADCDSRAASAEKKASDQAVELKRLSDALANCGNAVEEDVVIFFGYGVASLSDNDKTRLKVLAETIKAGEGAYAISGYADAGTGTVPANTTLSEKRAKNVYDYLIGCGVSADKLTYGGEFDPASEPYPGKAEPNRAAFVKITSL